MREDTFTTTEDAAGVHAALLGRSEDFGGGPGDQRTDRRAKVKPLGPDPWLPWTCSGCGHLDPKGQPEVCGVCGLRNYGVAP